ncbi:NACHT domain-containing protein [Candidatus Neptunochlamydia vexilliferae]|nr:NACHT domain-containing protein [Candidatus Neptunochlamydia vexilliferae]
MHIYTGKSGKKVEFTAVEEKKVGCSIGAIFKKTVQLQDNKRWMGKMGSPKGLLRNDSNTFRTRTKKEMNLDTIREKLAYDLFQELGRDLFVVPKSRLSMQPVRNQFNSWNYLVNDLIQKGIKETLLIMSRYMEGYQDFGKSSTQDEKGNKIPFMKYLETYKRPPEKLLTDKGELVPIQGLMGLLAVGRCLADVDLLGGGGLNAGFKWIYDENKKAIGAKTVKIDPGLAFLFTHDDPKNASENCIINKKQNLGSVHYRPKDYKDLQTSTSNYDAIIEWKQLTKKQKKEFLGALLNTCRYLQTEDALKFLIYRDNLFCHSDVAHLPENLALTMQKEMKEWINWQLEIYEVPLQNFKKQHPEQILRIKYIDEFGDIPLPLTNETYPIRELFTTLILENQKKEKKKSITSIDQLFNDGDRKVLITGRAGSGKSTLCRKVAHDWASGRLFNQLFDQVFYLPLREVNLLKKLPKDPKKLLSYLATELITLESKLQNAFLESINKSKSTLVIFDGLDEASEETLGAISSLVNDPDLYILASSRSESKHIFKGKIDKTFENIGFSKDQIKTYVHKFFSTIGTDKQGEKCLKQIESVPQLMELAENPLQLQMLCAIWVKSTNSSEIGISLTSLYKEMIDKVLDWQISQKKLEYLSKSKRGELLKQLGKLALDALKRESLILPHKRIETFLSTGLIQKHTHTQKYSFIHFTIQEYLAAYYLSNCTQEKQAEFLNKFKNRPTMERAIVFLCGHLVLSNKVKFESFLRLLRPSEKKLELTRKCYNECQEIFYIKPSFEKQPLLLKQIVPTLIENDPKALIDQKLKNPHKTLNTDESIALLLECVRQGELEAQKAKGKDITLFIGNTGAGKSTTINYLCGCTLELKPYDELGIDGLGDAVVVKPQNQGGTKDEIMPIGHTKISKTFMPKIETQDKKTYMDCPGFLDNRGAEINIANAVNIKNAIKAAKSAKVVILINYHTLKAGRARGLSEMLQIAYNLFSNKETLLKSKDSLLIGVTNTPENITLDQLRRFIIKDNSTLQKLQDTLFTYDPVDRSIKGGWKRAEFLNAIDALKPVPHHKRIFSTVLTYEDEHKLLSISEILGKKIEKALGTQDYKEAALQYQHLQSLNIIDHHSIERLLQTQKRKIDTHAQRLLNTFNEQLQWGKFKKAETYIDRLKKLATTFPQISLFVKPKALEKSLSYQRALRDARSLNNSFYQELFAKNFDKAAIHLQSLKKLLKSFPELSFLIKPEGLQQLLDNYRLDHKETESLKQSVKQLEESIIELNAAKAEIDAKYNALLKNQSYTHSARLQEIENTLKKLTQEKDIRLNKKQQQLEVANQFNDQDKVKELEKEKQKIEELYKKRLDRAKEEREKTHIENQKLLEAQKKAYEVQQQELQDRIKELETRKTAIEKKLPEPINPPSSHPIKLPDIKETTDEALFVPRSEIPFATYFTSNYQLSFLSGPIRVELSEPTSSKVFTTQVIDPSDQKEIKHLLKQGAVPTVNKRWEDHYEVSLKENVSSSTPSKKLEELYNKLSSSKRVEAKLHLELAMFCHHYAHKNFEAAKKHYNRAQRLAPKSPAYLLTHLTLIDKKQDPKTANALYKELMNLSESAPKLYAHALEQRLKFSTKGEEASLIASLVTRSLALEKEIDALKTKD